VMGLAGRTEGDRWIHERAGTTDRGRWRARLRHTVQLSGCRNGVDRCAPRTSASLEAHEPAQGPGPVLAIEVLGASLAHHLSAPDSNAIPVASIRISRSAIGRPRDTTLERAKGLEPATLTLRGHEGRPAGAGQAAHQGFCPSGYPSMAPFALVVDGSTSSARRLMRAWASSASRVACHERHHASLGARCSPAQPP
jgi:hypothetical protein